MRVSSYGKSGSWRFPLGRSKLIGWAKDQGCGWVIVMGFGQDERSEAAAAAGRLVRASMTNIKTRSDRRKGREGLAWRGRGVSGGPGLLLNHADEEAGCFLGCFYSEVTQALKGVKMLHVNPVHPGGPRVGIIWQPPSQISRN